MTLLETVETKQFRKEGNEVFVGLVRRKRIMRRKEKALFAFKMPIMHICNLSVNAKRKGKHGLVKIHVLRLGRRKNKKFFFSVDSNGLSTKGKRNLKKKIVFLYFVADLLATKPSGGGAKSALSGAVHLKKDLFCGFPPPAFLL